MGAKRLITLSINPNLYYFWRFIFNHTGETSSKNLHSCLNKTTSHYKCHQLLLYIKCPIFFHHSFICIHPIQLFIHPFINLFIIHHSYMHFVCIFNNFVFNGCYTSYTYHYTCSKTVKVELLQNLFLKIEKLLQTLIQMKTSIYSKIIEILKYCIYQNVCIKFLT